jgi:ribosomal protein L34E
MSHYESKYPYKVTCTSTNCSGGLHCFKFHSRRMNPAQRGTCRECGADLVDWERVHKRELSDIENTIESLKYELIRHFEWHSPIDEKAINHARRKGRNGMIAAVNSRLRSALAPATPFRDGQQTPMTGGNVIYYAQHATATCCRTCLEYWHGIPTKRPLTDDELGYCRDLIMAYIDYKLPFLTPDGEYVPRR